MSQSPHDPVSAHEAQEALLTAYALGQLSEAERQAAEAILARPDAAAVRQHVAEISHVARALATGQQEDIPKRSSELRRAVLAAAAQGNGTVVPVMKPFRKSRGWLRLAGAGVVVVTACLFVALLMPASQNAREVSRRGPGEEGDAVSGRIHGQTISLAPGESGPLGASLGAAPSSDAHPEYGRSIKSADDKQGQGRPADAGVRVDYSQAESKPIEDRWQDVTTSRLPLAQRHELGGGQQGQAAQDRVARETEITRRGVMYRSVGESLVIHGDAAVYDARFGALGGEQYNRFIENRFVASTDHPLSTFSIDVDTASYANTRRFLMAGQRPPRDAVRIEEFVNYFRYADPKPTGDVPFSVSLEAAACPWRPNHKVVRVGLAGRDVARDQRPAGNLVFLVDVSGSMADADKLPLVQQALLMLVDELTENDRVAIVTYAGDAGLRLPSTSGDQKEKIRAAIESLSSGGSTHGSAGITLAYEQAAERFIKGGANRVILATDGDLNVGITSDEALVDLITRMAKGGTFLTVLGFGQGNLQDEKMEKIADKGNGVYAYIDSVREARKVLVEQLTGSTITIAKDVKIQVEFNPARVASYRLLGYENRALADRDFRDDTKDAGEIGAGHGVTALYEIELVGDEADRGATGAEPLKYQPQPEPKVVPKTDAQVSDELLTVKLRYKQPDGDTSKLLEVPLADAGGRFEDASADLRFASAVAAFGMLLRGSEHAGDATLPMVAKVAAAALGDDDGGYRAEFLDLIRRAEQTR